MARTKDKIINESDAPFGEREAFDIFRDAGWPREDARWLAPYCLSLLPRDQDSELTLDGVTQANLELLAKSWSDASSVRNRALLTVFVRLCGCGGVNAHLGKRVPPQDGYGVGPEPWAVPHARRAEVASAFRSHGVNFESALIAGGWPGDYGRDNELAGVLMEYARDGAHPRFGSPQVVQLMLLLVDEAGLDLSIVIDDGAVIAAGCRRQPDPSLPHRIPDGRDLNLPPISDARSLVNWMIGLGPRALTSFFPAFLRCPKDDNAVAMAMGVQDAIERWLVAGGHHWTYFGEGKPQLAEACQPYLDELERRCNGRSNSDVPKYLRRVWLWFAWCTFEADPSRLTAERREMLLRAATEDVAALRKLVARAEPKPVKDADVRNQINKARLSTGRTLLKPLSPAELCQGWRTLLPQDFDGPAEEKVRAPWEEFEWERDHLQTCVMLLYQLGGVWRGMKALLLALRSLNAPAVAEDLRYWNEADRLPRPEPWSVIPESMIALFHAYVGEEQKRDSSLRALRGELASYCVERLVDRWSKAERDEAAKSGRKRTNDDMMERSPEWRLCLIKAFVALGLNPEAKGHRVLHTASEIDPDPDVREAAREAYQRVRRGMALPDDVSPRRAIMSALWFVRQGHLLDLQARFPELEIRLDPDGAQRTRAKELSRTMEAERI